MKSGWFWDWIAERYDRQASGDGDLSRNASRLRRYLQADGTVLDYACGTGVVSLEIAADVEGVHAIDTSARMIEIALRKAAERGISNVRFEQKSLLDEELEPATYDVVAAFNILHLVEDASEIFRRARELLKPGGRLVSVTPCLREAGIVPRILVPLVAKLGLLAHLSSFRVADLRERIADAGLEIEEADVLGDGIPSFFCVARRR